MTVSWLQPFGFNPSFDFLPGIDKPQRTKTYFKKFLSRQMNVNHEGGIFLLGVFFVDVFFYCCRSGGTETADSLALNGYRSAPIFLVFLLFSNLSHTLCLAIFGMSGCHAGWLVLCIT